MDNEFWQLLGQLIIVFVTIGGLLTAVVIIEMLYDNYKMRRINQRINGIRTQKMRQSPDE